MWGHLKWISLQRTVVFWNVTEFERNMPIYHHYLASFSIHEPWRRRHSPSEHLKPVTQHTALHFRRLESLIIPLKDLKINRVSL